jgi:NADPH:quinone reductase-like Zn-dependent oxidoreductase
MLLAIESTEVAEQNQNCCPPQQSARREDFAVNRHEVEVKIDAHRIMMRSSAHRLRRSQPNEGRKGRPMKAVVYDRYGPPEVQRLEDVERPVPKEDDVLVKIRATTVTRTDCGLRSGEPFIVRLFTGLRRPKQRILGTEFAGEVHAIGAGVSEFAVGDEVFGTTKEFVFGAHAEFICLPDSAPLAHKPAGVSFEEAAAVCDGAILALAGLRPAGLGKGQTILVYGASGSIGTAGVQLAKYFGADITAVCSTKNLELVKSLGADRVIDYTKEDFTKNGEKYDIIFDAVGMLSFNRCRASLKPGGAYFPTDGLENVLLAPLTSRIGNKKVVFPLPPRYTKKDVLLLKELMETGRYRAVIDRRYALEDIVEATRYVETKQKTGNVVLTVNGGGR